MVTPYPYPYLREEEKESGLTGAPPLLIPTDLTGRTHQDIVAYNNQYHLHVYIPYCHIHSFIHSLFPSTNSNPSRRLLPRVYT